MPDFCICTARRNWGSTPPGEEVVEDGGSGRLVDFFDTTEIGEAVVEALARQTASGRCAHRARDAIIGRYDLKRHCVPE